jgi:hypothetical protein
MNIYLDIDGVLLANDRQAANYVDEFLAYVTSKFDCYWLTTHCWRGENRAIEVLSPYLKAETITLLGKIKSTDWGEMKTDAIDFSQPFIWFDDDLWPEEEEALEKNNALKSFRMINLIKAPNQLKEYIGHNSLE